jgi:ribosomal protein S18 acetylase RimI-like enzyme
VTDLRLGVRVEDVRAAMAFYRGLGFEEEGVVPGPTARPSWRFWRAGR